jgi:HPt (histidine-containing phosphotransfer) domain-containing protein
MVSILDTRGPDAGPDAAIDAAVLDQILGLGDGRLRDALIDQLCADFRRIGAALATNDCDEIGAAAHELKGLAATIGARRLAQLAKRLNTVADCAVPGELGALRAPVEGEIRVVLDSLATHSSQVRP